MLGKYRNLFHNRVHLLVFAFLLWFLLIIYRLVDLQILRYPELCNRAKRQRSRVFEIYAKRGSIYDRRKREMAVSINIDSIYAVPSEIANKELAASQLAGVLQLNRYDLAKKFKASRNFTWVKRKVDYAQVLRVKDLRLAGVYFQKESKRFYPKRELAAHVLGYVGMDNEGLSGLEFAYEKQVRGRPGQMLLMEDAKQRSFSSMEKPPVAGDDLILTIDEYIQYLVEQELEAQVTKSQAVSGTAIVMEPNSGEVLAMASFPTFNPNHYWQYSPDHWMNRAILSIYEPGSTFKVITAATALEERLAKPDERINCLNGSIAIGGRRIRDHKPYGILTVRQIVAYSSNVGAVQLGFRIGKDRFENYIRSFGFGQPTEIDLPGEARGLLRPASQWPPITLGTISMGQGIGVTPLQLLTAVSAIANGGYLVRPRVVKEVESESLQKAHSEPKLSPKRILSTKTTDSIKEMLTGVVSMEGATGKAAQLEGFSAAGKTGTAQKIDANGRYSHSRFIASFVGFAPLENPAIAIVVTIDEPRGLYYGGQVAAPVFRNIAEKILRYLSVSPDQPVTPTQQAKGRRQKPEVIRDQPVVQLEPLHGDQDVIPVPNEAPFKSNLPDQSIEPLEHGFDKSYLRTSAEVEVPDFSGKSIRAVLYESSKLGLQVNVYGSGLVLRQYPPPHTRVAPSSSVMVKFSRRLY
jgi:cell division protein FtsI/penicillin-binding protein 2